MKTLQTVFAFCATILVVNIDSVLGATWSYTLNAADGPSNWASSFPDCGGSSQSPIDIQTASTVMNDTLTSLVYNNYGTNPTTLTLSNNGHGAKISVTGTQTVSGAGLPNAYKLAQFHYHWGNADAEHGSEHTLNGEAHHLEAHFVHYDSSLYADLGAAAAQPNGLAVVGVFIEVSANDNTALTAITDYLSNVTAYEAETVIPSFALDTLLPTDRSSYFRYSGSLTTPGCHESVIWTVLNARMTVSQAQIDLFHTLLKSDNTTIEDSFRPAQPLNGRTVYSSFDASTGSAAITTPFSSLLLATIALTLFKC